MTADTGAAPQIQSTMTSRVHPYILTIALLLSFILLLTLHLPRIIDPYTIERDYRSLGVFHEGHLAAVVHTATESATPGYTLLMRMVGSFMSPALFAKLLPIPLLLISVYYIYRLGEQITGEGTALALALGFAVFNLAADTEVSVIAGLQRSFTLPLLLAMLYYLHNRRWAAAAIVLLLAGTIYLPIVLVCLLTYTFSFIYRDPEKGWQLVIGRRRIVPLLVAFVLVVIAALPVLLPRLLDAISSAIVAIQSGQHILADPYYRPGGRMALFVIFPIFGRAGIVSSASTAIQLIVLGLLALGIFLVRRGKTHPFPPVLHRLFYASLIAYSLSWLAILLTSSLLLYLPSRHTEFVFFLLLVFYVFLNIEETLNDVVRRLRRLRGEVIWLALPVLLLSAASFLLSSSSDSSAQSGAPEALRWLLLPLGLILVLLLALFSRRRRPDHSQEAESPPQTTPGYMWGLFGVLLLLISPFYIRATAPAFHSPDEDQRALYTYLQTLPEDAIIAGSPCALDDVQYYAGRQVLYSCWRFQEENILAGLDAYYAESSEPVAQFCSDFGVDYLVVDEQTLDAALIEDGNYFYEPYVTMLQPTLQGRSDFVLRKLPPTAMLFEVGTLSVVACDPVSWSSPTAQ